jgi:hypothetical protein
LVVDVTSKIAEALGLTAPMLAVPDAIERFVWAFKVIWHAQNKVKAVKAIVKFLGIKTVFF